MNNVSKQLAGQIVVKYIKKAKKTDRVNIAKVEENNGDYIVRGITPIVLEGQNWAERFTVHVDNKGKVKSTDYALI